MLKYIIKRTLLIFLTLFIILTIAFFLIKLLPDYPPIDPSIDQEYHKLLLQKYGYDKPIPVQYFLWVKNILTSWDWGESRQFMGRVAFEQISGNLPVTMKINIYSFLISMPLGFLFGIIAALKKNKLTDQIITFFVMLFISAPSFVVISLLVMVFAGNLGWLPIVWNQLGFPNSEILRYVIPVLALSFGPIASLTRYTRAELTEVLTSEYLLLARTKGLTRRQTILRHALRNSMIPLVGIVIGNFVGIIGGSVVIENIYSIPGVGGVLLNSISTLDYNVTMAVLAFYTIINLFAVLIVDLSYGIIDPRVRVGATK